MRTKSTKKVINRVSELSSPTVGVLIFDNLLTLAARCPRRNKIYIYDVSTKFCDLILIVSRDMGENIAG